MKKLIAILLLSSISYFYMHAKKFEVGKNKTYKSIKNALR